MPVFGAWQLSDLSWTGPDPFGSDATANASAAGSTTFTIASGADLRFVNLGDDDPYLEDGDGSQELTQGMAFNGVLYGTGASGEIETEYSYVIRPAGSTDPADNITIHVLEFEGNVAGIASSARLFAGHSYDIVAVASDDPIVPYQSLAVCFAADTPIATQTGPVAARDLREDMRVLTVDSGYRPLAWVGRWRVNGRGANAPIRFAPGVLGNAGALELSAQHRVLLRVREGPLRGEEILVAAKALVGLPGVTRAERPRADWVHFLFDRHEVVFADTARAESMLPGPQALRGIGPDQAAIVQALMDQARLPDLPARPIVPPGKAGQMLRLHRYGWEAVYPPMG